MRLCTYFGGAIAIASIHAAHAQDIATAHATQPATQPPRSDATTQRSNSLRTPQPGPEPVGEFLLWSAPTPLEGTISTDRPGFADTTSVVPRGHLQLEVGYTHTEDSEAGVRTRDHAFAQTNLRIGVLDNLEFRNLWNGFSAMESQLTSESPRTGRRFQAKDHDDGAGDMTLGLRSQLLKNDGLVPDLTFLTNLSVPVGSSSKTSGDVVPDLRLAYGWALNGKLRFYGVGIVGAPVSDGDRFFQAAGSAGLCYAWTDRLSTFVEYYGTFPGAKDEAVAHSMDGGFAFLLGDNCQLDFSAGAGLNEQPPDYFFGLGISFRW